MPREASITFEQVASLAESIKNAGGKPNARQIRERHGSGSLGTIHKLLQQWESGQSRQIETSLTLSPALQRVILEFISNEISNARNELESKLADAQQAANDLATENERQAKLMDEQEESIERIQAEKDTLAGRVAQMENDLVATREEATRERQAAEVARTELAKAQLRLEATPILEQENERLRSALELERNQRTDAERQAASSEAKATGLADRFADAQESIKRATADLSKNETAQQRLNEQLAEAQKEIRSTLSQIGQLQGTVSVLQQQLEQKNKSINN